mmetsp:Transcript_11543/g.22130  ORF Transcript_11543/g.22130 Transcript_11543/m.22130 type:complete len:90 (+) Transcript_11543:468-737(+)
MHSRNEFGFGSSKSPQMTRMRLTKTVPAGLVPCKATADMTGLFEKWQKINAALSFAGQCVASVGPTESQRRSCRGMLCSHPAFQMRQIT